MEEKQTKQDLNSKDMDKEHIEKEKEQQQKYQNFLVTQGNIVSVKEWLITLLIMMIPVINIIMMFIWAFGGGVKESKANFFKAQLIYFVLLTVITIILSVILGSYIYKELVVI